MWLQKVSLGGSLAAGSLLAVLLLGWSLLGSSLTVGAAQIPPDGLAVSSKFVAAAAQEPGAVAVEPPANEARPAAPRPVSVGPGGTTARLDQKTVDELLERPINFSFRNTEWFEAFTVARHHIPVEIDLKLVEQAGIKLHQPIDLNLGTVSAGTALRVLLQPHGLEVKLIDGRLKIVRTADAASPALSGKLATPAGGETQAARVGGAAADSQSVRKWQTRSGPARIAVARIRRALDEQTEAEFVEMPLNEGIAFFSALHDIPMQFDTRALAEAGLSLETPITMERKQLSLESALRQLGDSYGFDFVIQYEALLITTPERAAALKETRVYDLRAFPEKVVEALTAIPQLQVVAATSAEDGVQLLMATGNQRSLREFEDVIDRVWRTLHSGE